MSERVLPVVGRENSPSPLAPRILAIAAVARNRVIGRDGGLPWRLKADLQRFRRLTMGHRLIMGRKTWESIGRPLPGRTSIVLTRSAVALAEGVIRVGSVDQLMDCLSQREGSAFCVGGAQIYRTLLPLTDELLLTRVEAEVEGDVLFPEIDWQEWRVVESDSIAADEDNEYPTTFKRLRRLAMVQPEASGE